MTEQELKLYLQERYPTEDACCEWKEFKQLKHFFNGHEGDDVVSYVSAIANMNGGHLVIGVEDGTLEIVGTNTYNYSPNKSELRLLDQCTYLPSEGLIIEEHITSDSNKTVWIIHIPKHLPRRAILAHGKAWQRVKDNLIAMTHARAEAILNEPMGSSDWSAAVIPDATIDDLDPAAIKLAREKFKELHNHNRDEEVDSWSDEQFLNKAKITIKSKITRAAIILLGRPESDHYLNPAICKIRWMLKDERDENKDFRVFTIPMILAIEEIGTLIRNTTYTYTISGSMFPETMKRYDVFSIREPLNNAIAHQDYSKSLHIDIIEREDESLSFKNAGRFIPESIEVVVTRDWPEGYYRNHFLVEAMRNVKMVETEGGGIKKLFLEQKRRFFPMPEYDISGEHVFCTIEGRVLDENFANILASHTFMSLADIMLLDKVQKQQSITKEAADYLRKKGFIEGRFPNVYLSSKVVGATQHVGLKTSYIKNRSFDDAYFKKLIIDYIKEFGKATRAEIATLLLNKLPEALSDQQKYDKITTLLSSLKRAKKIKYDNPNWVLVR